MLFFVFFLLLDKENIYCYVMFNLIYICLKVLWDNIGFIFFDDLLRVGYYLEIDMLVWVKKFYGDEFV